MARLSRTEQTQIEGAVKAAEKRTSAQFALVVARASDDYAVYPFFWAAILALISGGLIALSLPSLSLAAAFGAEVSVFVAAALLFHVAPLRFWFVPSREKVKHATALAQLQFAALVHERTESEVALLLFVSTAERHVEILVDSGIASVVPSDIWQAVIDQFLSAVREGKLARGFIDAIEESTQILERYFPSHEGRKNEIPDQVVQI